VIIFNGTSVYASIDGKEVGRVRVSPFEKEVIIFVTLKLLFTNDLR